MIVMVGSRIERVYNSEEANSDSCQCGLWFTSSVQYSIRCNLSTTLLVLVGI